MATHLVQSALENLWSLCKDEHELMQFFNQEKKKLESNLSAIESVLQDAEEKQFKSNSRELNDWLKKLQKAVYELEDILDECSTEAIRDKFEGDRSCSFLSFLHPYKIMFRHNICSRMKAVRENLDNIAQEKSQFSLAQVSSSVHVPMTDQVPAEDRLTASNITEDFIYGRENEKEDLVNLLLEDDKKHAENLSVYSIVAMGGLGKTILAKFVYNDERVQRHFNEKIWICVSENFEFKTLIKGIIGSSRSDNNDNLEHLQKQLRDMLRGKKYLLVLDDVWNEDPDKWLQFRSLLSCGMKGSSILVTTRQKKIAIIMETLPIQPYSLEPLCDDDCWQIFRKHAFRFSVANETENLITIGKQIAKKCKGVPLVAKVLGGLLNFQSNERYWHGVRDSELWDISDWKVKDPIFGPLRLSYLNLPLEYRRCFSYCAVFSKDYLIDKEHIILLWMANGLIPSKGRIDLEDIGDDIVMELYWRSLIQDIEKEDGVIKRFKLHDLIHDLVHYITGDDIYVADGTSSKDLKTQILHVSIGSEIQDSVANKLSFPVKCLRSFINLNSRINRRWIEPILSEHTSLRALYLSDPWLRSFPSSICHPVYLKHLRLLNLSCYALKELPKFICSMWNLQTLILNNCAYLTALPEGIGRLKNLRHLDMKDCWDLSSLPRSIGGLTSLRTFNLVIVDEVGKSGFQLSTLGSLNCVKGKMKIMHLERVKEVKHAQEANLLEKNLDRLTLEWKYIDVNDQQLQVQIFEALRPSPKLKYLKVSGYEGKNLPQWMTNDFASFKYIQSVCLKHCRNCLHLSSLWRLSSLKSLELFYLLNLRYLIEVERDSDEQKIMCINFPSLEKLTLRGLDSLEGVFMPHNYMNHHEIFPLLSDLTIERCPRLDISSFGPLPSLRSYPSD